MFKNNYVFQNKTGTNIIRGFVFVDVGAAGVVVDDAIVDVVGLSGNAVKFKQQ